jgi:hypothetical protein
VAAAAAARRRWPELAHRYGLRLYELALANLLERDRLFTERLRRDAETLGLETIEVDGTAEAGEVAGRVAQSLCLA